MTDSPPSSQSPPPSRPLAAPKPTVSAAIALLVVVGFLAAVFVILYGAMMGAEGLKDPSTTALAGGVIGYVSAKADQVVSFFFGASEKG
jgi:hypothetical protein